MRILLVGMGCLVFLSVAAVADPVMISPDESFGPPRTDPGQGLCARSVHFAPVNPGILLGQVSVAQDLLDGSSNYATVDGQFSYLLKVVNLHNSAATAQFPGPLYDLSFFPFSIINPPDSMAGVPAGDDIHFAMRLRGLLNISDAGIYTFGLNCDDGCGLEIGHQIAIKQTLRNPHWYQPVQFQAPGLYPVELVHYQNKGPAYFEWTKADGVVLYQGQPLEGGHDALPVDIYPGKFTLLQLNQSGKPLARDFYPNPSGKAIACQECGGHLKDTKGDPVGCPGGEYCEDRAGLCFACDTSLHCGPSCMKCPTDKPTCHQGVCIQCLNDGDCRVGESCSLHQKDAEGNPTGNQCGPYVHCNDNGDCEPEKVCLPDPTDSVQKICLFPQPCEADQSCPENQVCTKVGEVYQCLLKVTACSQDSECPALQYCDEGANVCRTRNRFRLGGGCQMSPALPWGGAVALFLSILLVWISLSGGRRFPPRR